MADGATGVRHPGRAIAGIERQCDRRAREPGDSDLSAAVAIELGQRAAGRLRHPQRARPSGQGGRTTAGGEHGWRAGAHVGADELAPVGERDPHVSGAEGHRPRCTRQRERPPQRHAAAVELDRCRGRANRRGRRAAGLGAVVREGCDQDSGQCQQEDRRHPHPRRAPGRGGRRTAGWGCGGLGRGGPLGLDQRGGRLGRSWGHARGDLRRGRLGRGRRCEALGRWRRDPLGWGHLRLGHVGRGLRRRHRPLGGVERLQRPLQLRGEVTRGGKAILRAFGHRLGDDRIELLGDLGHRLSGRGDRVGHVRVDLGHRGGAVVGHVPRERLEQHATERVDVRGGVSPATLEPLRRGVVDRADERARACERISVGPPGDPEVGQIDVVIVSVIAACDQDVCRFDVAVDETAPVGRGQCRGDRPQQLDRPPGGHSSRVGQQRAQVGARYPAHDQVQRAVQLARLVDGDDVGVLDRRGQVRLALEALPEAPVRRQPRGDRLQRDRSLQRQLGGAEHDAHATAACFGLDSASGKGRARSQAFGHTGGL